MATDIELFTYMRDLLVPLLPGVAIIRSYQPNEIPGRPLGAYVSMHKIGDVRYGSPRRSNIWDADAGIMRTQFVQAYESTFQLTGDTAEATNVFTTSDMINQVASYLQTDEAIAHFRQYGVGLLRIRDVRQVFFTNDRDQQEADPSFDFTLAHERAIISAVPAVSTVELNIQRV